MAKDFFRFIPCSISRSGFDSERVFEIQLDAGEKLVGTANVSYLRDSERRRLDEATPGFGETIQGFVQCRQIEVDRDQRSLVELPSADLLRVRAGELEVLE